MLRSIVLAGLSGFIATAALAQTPAQQRAAQTQSALRNLEVNQRLRQTEQRLDDIEIRRQTEDNLRRLEAMRPPPDNTSIYSGQGLPPVTAPTSTPAQTAEQQARDAELAASNARLRALMSER